MTRTDPRSMSATLKAVVAAVRLAAAEEIMPRYLKVAHQRKSDDSLCTEADVAAQTAFTKKLQATPHRFHAPRHERLHTDLVMHSSQNERVRSHAPRGNDKKLFFQG